MLGLCDSIAFVSNMTPNPDSPRIRHVSGPATMDELAAGLIWPRLLRAPLMAVEPSRLLIAFIAVAVLLGSAAVFDSVAGQPVFTPTAQLTQETLYQIAAAVVQLDFGAVTQLSHAYIVGLRTVGDHSPWLLLLFIVFALPIVSLSGGAICRIAICDEARNWRLTFAEGVAHALARWRDCILAIAAPVVILVLLGLVIKGAGAILFISPIVSIFGAILYGAALLATTVFLILIVALGLGHMLLLPAVAADPADWVDALQRAYAYVLGRTGRLLLYLLLCAALASIAISVSSWLVGSSLDLTAALVLPDDIAPTSSPAETAPDLPAATSAAIRIVSVWERVVIAILLGYWLSLYFTLSSTLYLLVRRVNDEQDVRDIWAPSSMAAAASDAQ